MSNPEHRQLATRHSQLDTQRVGQTLIAVLWVVGMLSLALGGVTMQSVHELRLTQIPLARLQGKAAAETALHHAIAVMQRDAPDIDHLGESWATGLDQNTQQAMFEGMSVGAGAFSIGSTDPITTVWHAGLVDEERKLNVNAATLQQLQRLFELIQSDSADAPAVATAIVDWRTKNEPETGGCKDAHPPCHNSPLDSVDELRLIPGVKPEFFAALEPYVTVYGGGAVNVNTAPAIVLNALGCDGDALLGQRQDHPFTATPAACPGTVVQSTAFTATIEAWGDAPSLVVHARTTFDRAGTILTWTFQ